MSAVSPIDEAFSANAEYSDVVIIGAGVSGIGAGCQLRRQLPDYSFTILEGRENSGGTWDLFKFPGIRSDSDLFTYGYEFKPWQGKPIATAEAIREYIDETATEYGVDQRIRYSHSVSQARWNTEQALWEVHATDGDGNARVFTGRFLWMCCGYFSYDAGYFPELPGQENYQGRLIHAQDWTDDVDYSDQEVVVIGSGATAVTVIPAMAERARKVTMLQRSPSYVLSRTNDDDEFTGPLRALDLPDEWVHETIRRYNLAKEQELTWRSRNEPEGLAEELITLVREALPEGYDVDTHFRPRYNPWDERLCMVPDNDLFQAISSGKAAVATGEIDTFTADGIRLKSGEELKADVVMAATGIELETLGGIEIFVDDQRVNVPDCWSWNGAMISDLPNMVWVFGYLRSSWTLRADMIANFVCGLLKEMDTRGVRQVTPTLRAEDRQMEPKGYFDLEDFGPGYIRRGVHRLPRQGDRGPWVNSQDYYQERERFPELDLDDGTLVFGNPSEASSEAAAD